MRYAICYAVLALASTLSTPTLADDIRPECTPSFPGVRYRLFSTTNIWTRIKLDTQTGRLWQVQVSLDGKNTASFVINDRPLVQGGSSGRFTLCPTGNMWNFVMLDQDTGRTWQAWYSQNAGARGVVEIHPGGLAP